MARNETIFREPIPEARSIAWLPVGDPKHFVASLHHGANRRLFVRQETLAALNAIGAASGRQPILGLLLGALFECPVTHTDFMVVTSLSERTYSIDQAGNASQQLTAAVRAQPRKSHRQVMGWYIAAGTAAMSVDAEAAHRSVFDQPWPVLLTLGSSHDGVRGKFFRWDAAGGLGSYAIPFGELIDEKTFRPGAPLPTAIGWSTYVTGNLIVPIEQSAPTELVSIPLEPGKLSGAKQASNASNGEHYDLASALRRAATLFQAANSQHAPLVHAPLADDSARPETDADGDITISFTPGAQANVRSVPDQQPPRETRQALSTPRAPKARDRHETTPAETSAGDSAERYIQIAREDGFVPVASFATAPHELQQEELWVLHDPYCGLVLIVISRDSAVLDASLQYNLRVEDPAILHAAFSEHRDLDASTVYRRETCVDRLRTRCRQLRDSEALVHDWTVTPSIYFVTPGEWEALAGDDPRGGARAIQLLNKRRIAEMPATIVERYGFGKH